MIFLNVILLSLKVLTLVLINAILNNSPIPKIVLLAILLCLLFLLIKYPRPLNSGEELIKRYKIYNRYDLIFCQVMISLYIIIFIICIVALRFYNIHREVNIKELIFKFYDYLSQFSFLENILNIGLICVFILSYMLLLYKIIKYLKKFLVQFHIYYSGFEKGTIEEKAYQRFIAEFPTVLTVNCKIDSFIDPMVDKFYTWFFPNKKFFPINLLKYYSKILRYGHYCILLYCFLYDMFFYNYTLHYVFICLPFVFLYDIYVKFSNFIENINVEWDYVINHFLYSDNLEEFDEETIWLVDEFVSKKMIRILLVKYLHGGLNYNNINDKEP